METGGSISKGACEICAEPLQARPLRGRCALCGDSLHRYCALDHTCAVGDFQAEDDGRVWFYLAIVPLVMMLLFGYELVVPPGPLPETLSLGKRRVHQSDYSGYSLALKRRSDRRRNAPAFVWGSAAAIVVLVGIGVYEQRRIWRQWHLGPERAGNSWRPRAGEARRLLLSAVIGAAGEPEDELKKFVVAHEIDLKSRLTSAKGRRFSMSWWPELAGTDVRAIGAALKPAALESLVEPLLSLALFPCPGRDRRVAELTRIASHLPPKIGAEIEARLAEGDAMRRVES